MISARAHVFAVELRRRIDVLAQASRDADISSDVLVALTLVLVERCDAMHYPVKDLVPHMERIARGLREQGGDS